VTPADGEADGAAEGDASDRRRVERRAEVRLLDLSLPELRRVVLTSVLFVAVLAAFLWMVRRVIVAAILGALLAAYLRPLYGRLLASVGRPAPAAMLALLLVLAPLAIALGVSYAEVLEAATYVGAHQAEIAERIREALIRFGISSGPDVGDAIQQWVLTASDYGARLPGALRRGIAQAAIAITVFLFTAFYIFTDADSIVLYVRSKVPPRYAPLAAALEHNVRGVLYGAVYATVLTQTLKSVTILLLNLLFGVPLAGVLAVLSFVIGFFPIVGSWSVYVPVAAWLLVFRNAPVAALLMLATGFLLNTVFISMYLRPKLAAEKSRVLNFYWMFVALVTGVYAFGLPGILLGPIVLGLLKAVIDTVTGAAAWPSGEDETETATTGVGA
jgi:predicted PurR-regulated permease PerM